MNNVGHVVGRKTTDLKIIISRKDCMGSKQFGLRQKPPLVFVFAWYIKNEQFKHKRVA